MNLPSSRCLTRRSVKFVLKGDTVSAVFKLCYAEPNLYFFDPIYLLSIGLFIYVSICVYLSIYLSIYANACLSIYIIIYSLPVYLSVYISVRLFICLCMFVSVCLHIFLLMYRKICLFHEFCLLGYTPCSLVKAQRTTRRCIPDNRTLHDHLNATYFLSLQLPIRLSISVIIALSFLFVY
jgi:hypothetical protein